MRASKVIAAALSVVAVLAAGILYVLSNPPKRNRYLIPETYAGWLCISYSVNGAPPLAMEDGFRLVTFPSDGIVLTSSEGSPGKMRDEFYRYAGDNRKELEIEKELGGGYTKSNVKSSGIYTFMFWVSPNSKEDYSKFVKDRPDTCGPFPNYPDTLANKSLIAHHG